MDTIEYIARLWNFISSKPPRHVKYRIYPFMAIPLIDLEFRGNKAYFRRKTMASIIAEYICVKYYTSTLIMDSNGKYYLAMIIPPEIKSVDLTVSNSIISTRFI